MPYDEILEALTDFERLPEAAIREATARRAEIVPIFLREIEAFLDDDDPDPDLLTPLFMIFHLLGSWREKSAYRLIARFLTSDPERLRAELDDSISMTVPRVMLNLFDGDPQPIYDIIACKTADEFIRAEMLELIATLAYRGDIARDDVACYLREAYTSLQPQGESYVWSGWESAIASLGLSELSDLVDEAFDRGFIDPFNVDKDDFRREMSAALADPTDQTVATLRVTPFGDIIEELSTWYGFSEEAISGREDDDDELDDDLLSEIDEEDDFLPVETVINPYRDVGRNDPCPCGSGKKFKRCCLGKTAWETAK